MASYEGWSNWETWDTNLWLTNDQRHHTALRIIVSAGGSLNERADMLETYTRSAFGFDRVPETGLVADLFGASEINWSEIVRAHEKDDS